MTEEWKPPAGWRTIIGIDPGTRRCGWGIISIEGRELRYHASGVWKLNPRLARSVRLGLLHDHVTGLLAAQLGLRGDLDHIEVAIEQAFVHQEKSKRSGLAVAEARGAVIAPLAACGMPVHEYANNTVKAAVTARGRANKEQVRKMVAVLLKLDAEQLAEDEADALAVVICHALTGRKM